MKSSDHRARLVLTDPPVVEIDPRCPRCGADEDQRVASGGFGLPHPVCQQCGHEWHDLVWQPSTEKVGR